MVVILSRPQCVKNYAHGLYVKEGSTALKHEDCYDANFVVTGVTGCGYNPMQ